MKRPFEVFQDFLKLFLEKGYIETNDDKNVTGYIVNVEDYERIKDYLSGINKFLEQLQQENQSVADEYNSLIQQLNKQIDEINMKLQNIKKGQKSVNVLEIKNILSQIVAQISTSVDIEINSFKTLKDSSGKVIGGQHATVSDPSRNDKIVGGVIKAKSDTTEYTGKYLKLDELLQFLNAKILEINQELDKANDDKDIPVIPNLNKVLSKNGEEKIRQNKGLDGVKVTEKYFLRKRTAAVLVALGISAAAIIASLRGKIINISGATGNEPYQTTTSQETEHELDEYDKAIRGYSIDAEETNREKVTLGEETENVDSNLYGEEIGIELIKNKEAFEEKKKAIDEEYKKIKNPTNEQFLEYQKAINQLLIEIYEQEYNVLVEDNKTLEEGIDANNRHIEISNGTVEPKDNQHGLVGSLDEKDVERHELQNEQKEKSIEKNEEKMSTIQQKIEETKQKIEFTEKLKESGLLSDLEKDEYENVYESVYKMYLNHSDEMSIDDFLDRLLTENINLTIIAEYAKEENGELSMEETLSVYALIQNSLEVYMQEYNIEEKDVNISSYVQYVNQFILDNPEIGKEGSVFETLKGQFLQNDMNRAYYTKRQKDGKKEGVFKTILRNIKTIFDKERREEYKKASKSFSEMIAEKDKSDLTH